MSKTLEEFTCTLHIPDWLYHYLSSFQYSTKWFTSLLLFFLPLYLQGKMWVQGACCSGGYLLKKCIFNYLPGGKIKKKSLIALGPEISGVYSWGSSFCNPSSAVSHPVKLYSLLQATSCAVPGGKLLAPAFTPGAVLPFTVCPCFSEKCGHNFCQPFWVSFNLAEVRTVTVRLSLPE